MQVERILSLFVTLGLVVAAQTNLIWADFGAGVMAGSQPGLAQLDPPGQAGDIPAITHGPVSGEVSDTSIVLWARGSTPGVLKFEVAGNERFEGELQQASVEVTEASDLTGEVRVEELEPGQTYYYQVVLEADGQTSEAAQGSFKTAPAATTRAGFSFLFSACLGGQGYCRDPETGWQIFETMLVQEPDFFILTGDSIYADTACPADSNVPGAEGPYDDLAGLRARYRYHLEDPHYARFLAQTPIYVTWDDHEIINDFSGQALATLNPQLFADGQQAYFEYWPIMGSAEDPYRLYRQVSFGGLADFFILDTRSYRDPNVNWDPNPRTLAPKSMLGAEQFAWLQQELAASEATWKFIVTSVPLSYPTGFPQPEVDGRDSWANYTERSGYESELTSLLFFIESEGIQNVVFLAGDTHWPYAISYDPDRNGEVDFYEFGSSPMSAIPLAPPQTLDPTFNPTVLYAEGEFQGTLFNFGQVSVADDGSLTFRVLDRDGVEHYALELQPE
jgi:alkaline phosphatase D